MILGFILLLLFLAVKGEWTAFAAVAIGIASAFARAYPENDDASD